MAKGRVHKVKRKGEKEGCKVCTKFHVMGRVKYMHISEREGAQVSHMSVKSESERKKGHNVAQGSKDIICQWP